MAASMLTAARLREVLHYDPETGVFTRLLSVGGKRKGTVAGGAMAGGYVGMGVDGNPYLAHRLAFLWMNGTWPVADVDHIDGDLKNNRWRNLRDIPHAVNMQNQRLAQKGTKRAPLLGASADRNSFRARITVFGDKIHLGSFRTAADAHQCYLEAKRRLHPGCTI